MSGVNFAAAPAGLLGGLGMLRRCATMCAERARCCSSGGGGLLAPQGVGSARRRGCGRRKRGLAPNPGGSQPACLPLTDPPISRTPRVPALLCHLSESTGIVKHPLRGLGRAWEGATEVWARHQRLSAATAACAGVTGTRGSPAVSMQSSGRGLVQPAPWPHCNSITSIPSHSAQHHRPALVGRGKTGETRPRMQRSLTVATPSTRLPREHGPAAASSPWEVSRRALTLWTPVPETRRVLGRPQPVVSTCGFGRARVPREVRAHCADTRARLRPAVRPHPCPAQGEVPQTARCTTQASRLEEIRGDCQADYAA